MARLTRPDGAEIHWEATGEGPLVALSSLSYQYPGVLGPFVAELARDHRVVTYHLRGSGSSSRTGPYDMDTDVSDLEAVIEAAGGDALAVSLGDGARRAVRLAAARPELVHTVVLSGDQLLGPHRDESSEALAQSPAVLDALVALMDSDYRAALRSMFQSGDPSLPEEVLHERLDQTETHSPREATVQRLRAWIADQSLPQALALGDRLWILHYDSNVWFSGSVEQNRSILAQANFVQMVEGVIREPGENAAQVRRIIAERSPATAGAPPRREPGGGGS